MALWHLRTVAPCFEYIDHGRCYSSGPRWAVHGELVTCPRHFEQSIRYPLRFFYEPGNDVLVLHLVMNEAGIPGWSGVRYEFNPDTGEWTNRDEVLSRSPNAYFSSWGSLVNRNATMGGFNKIYANYWATNYTSLVLEIDWQFGNPVPGGWSCDPYQWDNKSIYPFSVVNRLGHFVGGNGNFLDCWRNIDTSPEKFGSLTIPGTISYLAYESRNYCWLITKSGLILKADYLIPRWEMTSQVRSPAPDAKGYCITFDTKRKQVVVFCWRPDAADGACQSQLEFYYPMVGAANLTEPVPVTSLRANNRILFVSHLVGDAGEGLTPYTVEGELVEPAEGELLTPFAATELNGRTTFVYQAPDVACTETLRLKVKVEETL